MAKLCYFLLHLCPWDVGKKLKDPVISSSVRLTRHCRLVERAESSWGKTAFLAFFLCCKWLRSCCRQAPYNWSLLACSGARRENLYIAACTWTDATVVKMSSIYEMGFLMLSATAGIIMILWFVHGWELRKDKKLKVAVPAHLHLSRPRVTMHQVSFVAKER